MQIRQALLEMIISRKILCMKKLVPLFYITSLYALYMGNPAEPQVIDAGFFISQDSAISIKAGYEGDWVFDRMLKTGGHAIDRFHILMNQGVVSIGFLDRIELYGSVGSFSAQFWNRPREDGFMRDYGTHDRWTTGGGLKIILTQWDSTTLGVDGKYQYAAPQIAWTTVDGISIASRSHLVYQEWQVSLALSHTIDIFTPYIGATYSNVHATVSGAHGIGLAHAHFRAVNRNKFGMAVGCGLCSGRKVDLTFEARFFDEQAVVAAGNIKF